MLPHTSRQYVGAVLLVVYVVGVGLVSLRWLRPSTPAPTSNRVRGAVWAFCRRLAPDLGPVERFWPVLPQTDG
jgi:hypothetical protein